MAKERTENSKYKSRYSDSFIGEAQYITEMICEKRAQKLKKELPRQFWNLPEWKKFFQQQVLAANSLLKLYDAKTIITVLKNPSTFNVMSLRAPQLEPLFDAEKRRSNLKAKAPAKPEITVSDAVEQPRPAFSQKKSVLNKLKELDG